MLLQQRTNEYVLLFTEILSHFNFYIRNTRSGYSKSHHDWRRYKTLKLIFEPYRQRRPGRTFWDKYIF